MGRYHQWNTPSNVSSSRASKNIKSISKSIGDNIKITRCNELHASLVKALSVNLTVSARLFSHTRIIILITLSAHAHNADHNLRDCEFAARSFSTGMETQEWNFEAEKQGTLGYFSVERTKNKEKFREEYSASVILLSELYFDWLKIKKRDRRISVDYRGDRACVLFFFPRFRFKTRCRGDVIFVFCSFNFLPFRVFKSKYLRRTVNRSFVRSFILTFRNWTWHRREWKIWIHRRKSILEACYVACAHRTRNRICQIQYLHTCTYVMHFNFKRSCPFICKCKLLTWNV